MSDLRRLAEAATPGPWDFDPGRPYNSGLDPIDEGEWPTFSIPSPDVNSGRDRWTHAVLSDNPEADAAYIAAASPDVILALLDRAEQAKSTVERLRAVEAAARAVLDNAETDDNFEGEFIDWLVPDEQVAALREVLGAVQ